VLADAGTPRGTAHLTWGGSAAQLIDASTTVTDIRMETV
jgi:hypothetical protein